MTSEFDKGTVRGQDALRRQLALELRSLRIAADLTQVELSELTGIRQPKLSKLEKARVNPSLQDVELILAAFDARPDQRTEILKLVNALATEAHNIDDIYQAGLSRSQDRVKELELSSKSIRNFESTMLSGYVQTPDYMRAIIGLSQRPSHEIAAAVSARVERQQLLLYDSEREIEILLYEAALWSSYGSSSVMSAQLIHLDWLLGNSTMSIGIVPFTVQLADTPLHGFGLLDDKIVLIELVHGWQLLKDSRDVGPYSRTFSLLKDQAVFGTEAKEILSRVRSGVPS